MIVSSHRSKLVLNLRNPERVTTVIPTAKQFAYKGANLVAVPHRLDEVRVLRNMGFLAPSPVDYYYRWPGQFSPFAAQRATASFLTLNERAYVLNDMGTGKTLATLWAYDYLRSIGKVKKMLVIAPLSTLERTWADEVFSNFPHLTWSVLHGSKAKRLKNLAEEADIYIVNHDGIKVLEAELKARTDIDIVTIDELASFRNARTDRWKSLNRIVQTRKWVWGLTGTPTPNDPTDAWAQCRLITPGRVAKYSTAFRDATMKQLSKFKWVARDNATDIVHEAMQPAIRFKRDECVDLPPCLFQSRYVPMTPEQSAAYKDMLTQLYMEHQGEQVLAVNEAVKVQKLTQIACGVVYGADGKVVRLPNTDRINALKEVIDQAGSKVIIFVPFTGVLEYVARELEKDYTVAVINGAVSKNKRDTIFSEFQNTPDPRVLVAQPGAMSHGLTLTAANTIIWYAPTTSNEIYEQANARVSRPGQKLSQLIVHIEGSAAERKAYDRLKKKQKMQGLLLDIVQAQKKL